MTGLAWCRDQWRGQPRQLAASALGYPVPRWVASLGQVVHPYYPLAGIEICQVTVSWHNRTPLTEAVSSQEKKHLDSSFTQGKQRHQDSNFPALPVSGVRDLRKMVWTWILLHLLPVQAWGMKLNSAQRGSWYLLALCLSCLQMEIPRRWLCWRPKIWSIIPLLWAVPVIGLIYGANA